jgi:hypothetical protein
MLGAGLLLLSGYTAAVLFSLTGGFWPEFFSRPEALLPAATVVYALPSMAAACDRHDFGFVYRLGGAFTGFLALLTLALQGHASYLHLPARTLETGYQVVGLALSAGVVYHGVRLGRGGLVNAGALAFVVFLYVKLHAWWWSWMPKYLFFTLIGLTALGLLWLFRRVRVRLLERGKA